MLQSTSYGYQSTSSVYLQVSTDSSLSLSLPPSYPSLLPPSLSLSLPLSFPPSLNLSLPPSLPSILTSLSYQRFHDMDNVLDFIILEQVYKESLKRQWSSGDRFQSLIDDQYWSGTILKRRPFSEDTPNSVWQMYHIKWDDGATDQLSPWDLHPLEIDNGETGTQDYMLHDDATIDYLSLSLSCFLSCSLSLLL